jgi:hypothetical protein
MDESRLSVIFGGSCGFVPHTDGTKARVLLPARGRGWMASDKETIVPPHSAFIKFRTAYLAKDSPRQPDFVYMDKGGPLGICFLTNEILTLPSSLDGSLFLNQGSLKSKVKPAPADSRSLEWVARLDRFCKALHIDARYLGPTQPPSIAVALDISAGALEADFVPPDLFNFQPVPDNSSYQPQCLAGLVRVSSRVDGARVEIRSNTKDSLHLNAIDWEVRLEILNEVLDDIILEPQNRRRVHKQDFDFELLYDLTDRRPNDDHCHLPLIVTPGFQNDTRSHQGGDCKPIFFPPTPFK